jgi:hypothetical protein
MWQLFYQCDYEAVLCLDLDLAVMERNNSHLYNLQMNFRLCGSLSIVTQPQQKNHNLHEVSTLWSSGMRCRVVW